ncbi:MAG TPA: histidine kinase dimerization/phospho-acceptor domain-containing protein, partial [Flavisolibacter sp.]|nr:histidine kinase dimerization/phospho-acceptor domain-containing protein [Flavisolibacter sp.]
MNRKTFYAFAISFLLLIVVIFLNRKSFESMKEYTNAVNHTRDVITLFERLSNHLKSAQIYSATYDSLPEKELYALYKKEALDVNQELTTLRSLVKDNSDQIKLVDSLASMISGQIYTLLQKNIAEIVHSGEGWRLNYLFAIHEIINRGIAHEKHILAYRDDKLRESTSFNNLLGVVFSLMAIAIIVSTFLSTIFLSRRRLWLEGFLESILNTSQNGIVNYKAVRKKGEIADFKINFINRSAEQLLEVNPKSILGKKLKEIPSYVRELHLYDKYVEVVETGNSFTSELSYEKDGRERWFLVSLVKMKDGLTASFQEITQLKMFEEELKNNIIQLERSNDELAQYAYVASHDLQEPLRKIRSFGSYLQETQAGKLDEKGRLQLDKIMKSAERMSVLIKDILSYSSMRREEGFTETDLNKILETTLSDFDLTISQRKAVIEKNTLPTIEAIPLQMNQLFYNLINNSLKFAKEGQRPVITICSKELAEPKKEELELPKDAVYYEIVFSDNGIGFSQEYGDQIFGLFKRL